MATRSGQKEPPRGPRISREYLENYRRRRYVDAAAELLHEFGREGATVNNLVRVAGTARNSIYEVFTSGEDCIGYSVEIALEVLLAPLAALDGSGPWADEVVAAITGFYAVVVADPIIAALYLIHAAASEVEHGRRAALVGVERFAELLARGRAEAEAQGRVLPVTTEEYFAQAIVRLAARRVRSSEIAGLAVEAPAMAALVVGFYLGPETADRLPADPVKARSRR